jgi:hypothetical protein
MAYAGMFENTCPRKSLAKSALSDLKSASGKPECRFESGRGHDPCFQYLFLLAFLRDLSKRLTGFDSFVASLASAERASAR